MLFIDTLPYSKIILYTMLLTCATCLQTLSAMFIYYRYKYRRKNYWRVALEVTISIYLLSLLLFTAESYYHMTAGFYTIKSYSIIKWLITVILLLTSIGSYKIEKNPQFFIFPVLSFLTLPFIENILGKGNGYFYIFLVLIWNLTEAVKFITYYRLKRKQLSAFSAKEAIDRLDFGLMYFRSSEKQNGKIILENEKMQELTYKIAGKTVLNGMDFLNIIAMNRKSEQPIPCPLIYTLKDSSVWSFRLEPVYSEGEKYSLLIASDITDIYMVTEELIIKNRKLSEKNRKLEQILKNMDDICKSEEILKGRVFIHDTLG